MNYLIYLGIFMVGVMVGVVMISLLFVGDRAISLEPLLWENYQQNKIDERCLADIKETVSGFLLQ